MNKREAQTFNIYTEYSFEVRAVQFSGNFEFRRCRRRRHLHRRNENKQTNIEIKLRAHTVIDTSSQTIADLAYSNDELMGTQAKFDRSFP